MESIDKMRRKGLEVYPGDFAENITLEGFPIMDIPVGTSIRIGERVLLEITQIGKECHKGCAIFQQVGECIMPREGVFASVLEGGEVKVEDSVVIEKCDV
jgi:MOSC domain-containing protein YiiM